MSAALKETLRKVIKDQDIKVGVFSTLLAHMPGWRVGGWGWRDCVQVAQLAPQRSQWAAAMLLPPGVKLAIGSESIAWGFLHTDLG